MNLHLKMMATLNLSNKLAVELFKMFRVFFGDALNYLGNQMKKSSSIFEASTLFNMTAYELTNSMELLDTEHKLKTALKDSNILFEPQRFVINQKTVQTLGEFEDINAYGTIMPVKQQIVKFLEEPKVLENIIKTQNESMVEGRYSNVASGEQWLDILRSYEGKTVIPIALYSDEFNPDLANGPHAKNNKLNAYYYSFPTLPAFLTPSIDNIFVALLHRSRDLDSKEIACHGMDPALYALLEVLIPLEQEGVLIDNNGVVERIYIVTLQFFGDNLALNTVFGFNPAFNGHYVCRACTQHKTIMQQSIEIPDELIRNETNYLNCLNADIKDIHGRKGVRFDSQLNNLQWFKVHRNISFDLMHDDFLGIFKYDLIEILKYYCIENQIFSLDQFNKAKEKFDYGKKSLGDKTVDILDSHLSSEKIHMNAKEVWTLIECLPLILMSLVPLYKTCTVFKFTLSVVDVLHKITKKTYTNVDIADMEASIRRHHLQYLTVFKRTGNSTHFTIKFHNLLHYGSYIRRFGPLRNAMTFRFEQKHQQLKSYAHQCRSRKDLPLSLCKKMSLLFTLQISSNQNVFEELKNTSKTIAVNFRSVVPNLKFFSSINYRGYVYEIDDVVRNEDRVYVIKGIGANLRDNRAMLYCQELNVNFDTELNFYEVNNHIANFLEMDISTIRCRPVNVHNVNNKKYLFFRN